SILILASQSPGRTESGPTLAPLAAFFEKGAVFQDRNGDGAVDYVDARIELPDRATPSELAAAADVAARLGFETSAMDLPLVRGRGEKNSKPPNSAVYVGARSLAGTGVTLDAIGAAGLKAGEGVVAAFSVGGKPSVAIAGADDAGLE